MADLQTIRRLESSQLAGWPGLRSLEVAGWQIRLADGYTKRANSANALDPAPGATASVIARAEAFYAQAGQPCIVRLTPLAPVETDAALAARGYRLIDASLVLTRPLAETPPSLTIEIAKAADPDWLDGVAAAAGLSERDRASLERLVTAIRLRAGFARIEMEGRPVAFGLGVVDREWLGLFEILTAPAARGRGLGRRLVEGLLAWGAASGATGAYLQVGADNAGARKLYGALGFRVAYGYAYRVRP